MRQVDLDPHSPDFVARRDEVCAQLRTDDEPAWSTAHGGFAVVSRYDQVRQVLLDPGTFSSGVPGRVAVPPTDGDRPPLAPIEVDPPRHDQQVALVSRWFSRTVVDVHEAALRESAAALVHDRTRLEVVADLALPLVSHALALVLRLPTDDADRWVAWAHRVFATRVSNPELAARAREELLAYVTDLLVDRRASPRDDVFTDLAVGLVDGEPLSDIEAQGFGVNLLLAGRDATVDGLTTALVHLAQHPEDQRRLRSDRSLLPRAVEELLRVYSPIGDLGRVTTRPVELGGCLLPAGAPVGVFYGAANRDERVFEQPDRVLLDRRANRHLAFGHGVHRCLGAQVARLVLRTGLDAALDLPAFRLDEA
ncbi:MAG: cytochrome P450, partial [Frankiales bacterium]|nr:cytochrome P450 [Frankiales bacterium]